MAFEYTNSKTNRAPGIFSTHERTAILGDRSDSLVDPSSARARSKGRGESKTFPCPCREDASDTSKHFWKPIKCAIVEIVITRKTDRQLGTILNS